jgi:hypothetical protein
LSKQKTSVAKITASMGSKVPMKSGKSPFDEAKHAIKKDEKCKEVTTTAANKVPPIHLGGMASHPGDDAPKTFRSDQSNSYRALCVT